MLVSLLFYFPENNNNLDQSPDIKHSTQLSLGRRNYMVAFAQDAKKTVSL